MKKINLIVFMGICFSFLARAQSLRIVSPNGGESWQAGTVQAITWTATGIPAAAKVRLTLFQNGHKVGVIAANQDAGATGSHYDWTVGQYVGGSVEPGVGYKIFIDAGAVAEDFSDATFAINSGPEVVVIGKKHTELPPMLLKFPRLEVSDIDLAPNVDGFGIVFSYKNAGEGALPKASAVPVKPSYRVLIDGKEMAKGFLFIPAFAAPPGWEQTGYFGGQIILPSLEYAFDNHWYIGNMITVHINENKVMGMEGHSLTLRLKPIALKYKFDLVRNGISLDWSTGTLTVSLRLDGNVPAGSELLVYCGSAPSFDNYFMVRKPARPGSYVISKKLGFITIRDTQVSFYMNSYVPIPDAMRVCDMDYRNNSVIYLKFTRPNPNPVQ
jgi:hypothetical protein